MADPSFNPQPGDGVTVVDEEAETLNGRVVSREGNGVGVQVEIPGLSQSA